MDSNAYWETPTKRVIYTDRVVTRGPNSRIIRGCQCRRVTRGAIAVSTRSHNDLIKDNTFSALIRVCKHTTESRRLWGLDYRSYVYFVFHSPPVLWQSSGWALKHTVISRSLAEVLRSLQLFEDRLWRTLERHSLCNYHIMRYHYCQWIYCSYVWHFPAVITTFCTMQARGHALPVPSVPPLPPLPTTLACLHSMPMSHSS